MISKTLKTAIKLFFQELHSKAKDVSGPPIRATGTMVLICTGMNRNIINIFGLCQRDEMLRYLHVQAEPVMRNFSSLVLSHGKYSFLPHHEAPCF